LKRIIIIAAAAVAALGMGVTVGSTHQEHGSSPPPGVTVAPQDALTPDQQACEEAAQQLRAKHPHAYIGGCNHGESTLPTP
jgi:hypothetical protein